MANPVSLIAHSLSASQTPEKTSILDGYKPIHDILQSAFADMRWILDKRCADDPEAIEFVRDQAITLLDGTQLIPYPIKLADAELGWRFLALLPPSSDPFITSMRLGYSSGFQKAPDSLPFLEENKLPYRQGFSCIEGGNCFLVKEEEKSYAIVGCHSQILTLLALEEQEPFAKDQETIQKSANQMVPSDWAIRMARNWDYNRERERFDAFRKQRDELARKHREAFPSIAEIELQAEMAKLDDELARKHREAPSSIAETELQAEMAKLDAEWETFKKTQKFSNHIELRKALQAPLKEEERKKYEKEAALFEAKLQRAKAIMAKELGVEEPNLLILPQKTYHLDWEMCVGPNHTVYVQDEELVQKILNDNNSGTRAFKNRVANYLNASSLRAERDKEHNEQNAKLLAQIGYKTAPVAGFFEADRGDPRINFLNGLPLGSRLITNAAPENFAFLQEIFAKQVQQINPKWAISFVGNPSIQEVLARGAGLRCITRIVPT